MDNLKSSKDKLSAIKSSFIQNVNIKEIFSEEELDIIFTEFCLIDANAFIGSPNINPKLNPGQLNGNGNNVKKKYSLSNTLKINELLCDRTKFILNILKLSSEKLKKNNLNYLAKGVDW